MAGEGGLDKVWAGWGGRPAHCPPHPLEGQPGEDHVGGGVPPHRLCLGRCCVLTVRQKVVVGWDRSRGACAGPHGSRGRLTDHRTMDGGRPAPTGPALSMGRGWAGSSPESGASRAPEAGPERLLQGWPEPWAGPGLFVMPQPWESARSPPLPAPLSFWGSWGFPSAQGEAPPRGEEMGSEKLSNSGKITVSWS